MRCLPLAIAIVSCLGLTAQTVLKPFQASPAASVSQDLGLSTVKIDYHRPAVKGRKIWGALVPFGQVWRVGANDATTITFSEPVQVDGHALAAGTYSFFAIPGPDQWTLILNQQAKQWGAFNYQAGQDALRFQAKPRPGPFHEYLAYSIGPVGPDSLRVELAWENLAVGFDVALAAHDRYWAYLEKALAGTGPEEWQPLNQAAGYCLLSNTHLDQAMAWVDRSIRIKEGYKNQQLKAQLLQRAGRLEEALPYLRRAIALAAAGAPKAAQDELTALQAEWTKKP
jgi:tetratricopeptide (TPR) repeat protein